MLRLRLITGPLLILALLALMWGDERFDTWLRSHASGAFAGWSDPPRALLLLTAAALGIVPLAAAEAARLLRDSGLPVPTPLAIGSSVAALLSVAVIFMQPPWPIASAVVPTVVVAVLGLSLLILSRHRSVAGVVPGAAGTLLVAVYLGVLPAFLIAIRQVWSGWVVVGIVLTIKSSDIGAYFAGRSLGRNKLIPWLSPGKTWEGLVGGVITAAVVGGLLALATGGAAGTGRVPVWLGAVGGALLAVVGQLGDLAESLLKRTAGAKDSGTLLPGMGGVLDVIDSLLFAAPVAWWLLLLASSSAS